MPTQSHQFIALFLYRMLWTFVTGRQLGVVLGAPMRVRIEPRKYREPDILFMAAEHAHLRGEQYWSGADLVMEVVSPDDPDRDYNKKRQDYAQVGVAEYWIVDPRQQLITILALDLDRGAYHVHGEFRQGTQAHSKLLVGFALRVDEVFAAAV
jgi:Uma2 family endonuclease